MQRKSRKEGNSWKSDAFYLQKKGLFLFLPLNQRKAPRISPEVLILGNFCLSLDYFLELFLILDSSVHMDSLEVENIGDIGL